MYYDLIISGFGGQGIMLVGDIIAFAAISQGLNVTYFPSYGVEMRGGDAKCIIVISDKEIGSPVIGYPNCLIAMTKPALLKYQDKIKKGGLLILNTSLSDVNDITRDDIEKILIPANEIALKVGTSRIANMVVLGAFLEKTKILKDTSIQIAMEEISSGRRHDLISMNLNAIEEGRKFVKE